MAPSPWVSPALREQLCEAALRLAGAAGYRGLGTVEFLVDADSGSFYFIEANARLQVEHTVTEAVTGLDLVALQLDLAEGRTLAELGLAGGRQAAPDGVALQLRINTEKLRKKDGLPLPATGTLTHFEPRALAARDWTFYVYGLTILPLLIVPLLPLWARVPAMDADGAMVTAATIAFAGVFFAVHWVIFEIIDRRARI